MQKQKVEFEGKTLLVTGSPGFIGANLVIRLLKEMYSGTVRDNLEKQFGEEIDLEVLIVQMA